MTEKASAEVSKPLTCSRCGHVTPYIEGWMVSAVIHHILAVHGGNTNLLGRH